MRILPGFAWPDVAEAHGAVVSPCVIRGRRSPRAGDATTRFRV